MDSSIGIIGGADGPTAILVSASPDWWIYALIAAAAVAATVAVALFIKRKKK